MLKQNKILYILSGNLSTTPRALKSILLHKDIVEIMAVSRALYWESLDREIVRKHNLKYQYISLYRKPFLPWLCSTLKQRLYRFLYPVLKLSISANAFASEKASILLNHSMQNLTERYGAIIGHGYGALFPAWSRSKKLRIPFYFDMEDFHPGEFIRGNIRHEKQRRIFLIKRLLPESEGVSFSSPMIKSESIKLTGNLKQCSTVLNCFPAQEFIDPQAEASSLKLIWFSQNITHSRGLDEIISALLSIDHGWVLTLIGKSDEKFIRTYEGNTSGRIRILGPMPQIELHKKLSEYHVGLALETGIDENRKLCLSNKILAYAQAGLYILASNTPAQTAFIAEDPDRGIVTEMKKGALISALQYLIDHKKEIQKHNHRRYKNASPLSWEIEAEKLKALIVKH